MKTCRHGHGVFSTRHCGDCERARCRAWNLANPEKKRAADNRWKSANRDRIRRTKSAWAKANPSKLAAYRRNAPNAYSLMLRFPSHRLPAFLARHCKKGGSVRLTDLHRAWVESCHADLAEASSSSMLSKKIRSLLPGVSQRIARDGPLRSTILEGLSIREENAPIDSDLVADIREGLDRASDAAPF